MLVRIALLLTGFPAQVRKGGRAVVLFLKVVHLETAQLSSAWVSVLSFKQIVSKCTRFYGTALPTARASFFYSRAISHVALQESGGLLERNPSTINVAPTMLACTLNARRRTPPALPAFEFDCFESIHDYN